MSSLEQHNKRTATGVAAVAATIGAVAFTLADGEQEHHDAPEHSGRDPFDDVVPADALEQPAARAATAETVVDSRPSSATGTPTPTTATAATTATTATTATAATAATAPTATESAADPAAEAVATPTEPAAIDIDSPVATDLPVATDGSNATGPVTEPTDEPIDTANAADPIPAVDPLGGHSLTINVDFGPADDVVAPLVPTAVSNPSTNGPLDDVLTALDHAQLAQPAQPVGVTGLDAIVVDDPIVVDILPNGYNTIQVTVQAMPEPEPPAAPEPEAEPVYVPAAVNLGILGDPGPTEPLPPRKPLFDPNGPETVVQEELTFMPGMTLPDGTVVGADGHVPGPPAAPVPGDTSDWETTGFSVYEGPELGHHHTSMAAVMGGNLLLFGSKEQHPRFDDNDQ